MKVVSTVLRRGKFEKIYLFQPQVNASINNSCILAEICTMSLTEVR